MATYKKLSEYDLNISPNNDDLIPSIITNPDGSHYNALIPYSELKGLPGEGVPVGGSTNQVLSKASSTDQDTEWLTLTKSSVGLGNVDNTSDANKPLSTVTKAALDDKLDKTGGTITGDLDVNGDIYATNVFSLARYTANIGGTNTGGRQTVAVGVTADVTGLTVSYTTTAKSEIVEVDANVLATGSAGNEVYLVTGSTQVGSSHYQTSGTWENAVLSGLYTIPADTTATFKIQAKATAAAYTFANGSADKTLTYKPQIYVKSLGTV